MKLSEEIKKVRIDTMMTQAEFGKALGVSAIAVSNWENGVYTPSVAMMRRLQHFCEAHGYDYSDIEREWKKQRLNSISDK